MADKIIVKQPIKLKVTMKQPVKLKVSGEPRVNTATQIVIQQTENNAIAYAVALG